MTSEERVLTAFRFERPDRIPIFDKFWKFPKEWEERFGDLDDLADIYQYAPNETILPTGARTLKQEDDVIISVDGWGRTLRRRVGAYFAETLQVPLTDKVDLCHAWVEFPSGLVANLTASRVSAERIRKLRLFANEGYFSIDYAEQSVQSARLVRSESGADIQPRIVEVEKAEPLAAELEAFVKACRREKTPLVDGRTGAAALAAAIRVRESVEART